MATQTVTSRAGITPALPENSSGTTTPRVEKMQPGLVDGPVHAVNVRTIVMGIIVSTTGFMFGYEGGSIGGYVEMMNFREHFGDTINSSGEITLGKVRTGCMVAFLCIGCLLGSLISAPFADRFGRKYCIAAWSTLHIVGNIVQISASKHWYQVPIGRLVAGLAVGACSVLAPMYQSETAPRQVRSVLVSAYQLFITLGIFTAYCINYGTETRNDTGSWRITMGCGFISPVVIGVGMLFMRESPRWDFSHGHPEAAALTLSLVSKVPIEHVEIQHELAEMREKLAEEANQGETKWHEIFTGPAMARRTIVGVLIQALQQLTGANFFFYYGTQIFSSVGISNSYVTSMILGGVNFGSTIVGLWVSQRFGRRLCLIVGGVWMGICFLVFASLGSFSLYPDSNFSDPNAVTSRGTGGAMIAFACLFIFGFATTWGCLCWAIAGEMYPSRHRARCMALCMASNWLWNFLISFFTPFITAAINYRYGYVFAGCCFAGALLVFFFIIESHNRSLEEVDTMYVRGVVPWKSASWTPDDEGPENGENGEKAS
ncbi:major facilitator superfamily transporter monosaccharide [Grosmannia clavigera kw1407]|uniref:Major facilitator superfamily transporter monosaccharide n=1 Tax=Grosmannia clavigera (strain kw1407 / UAMH 11150) TaxID=655863 RepID=F0XAV5_GROCL|nr:major facilitator superfamily transporter monosaccharide [Grosmannia clavigera kw1407]EFX05185.1 major facilitator superfamily transporter monosaccharide [Grosmannia clavigera kw1407]